MGNREAKKQKSRYTMTLWLPTDSRKPDLPPAPELRHCYKRLLSAAILIRYSKHGVRRNGLWYRSNSSTAWNSNGAGGRNLNYWLLDLQTHNLLLSGCVHQKENRSNMYNTDQLTPILSYFKHFKITRKMPLPVICSPLIVLSSSEDLSALWRFSTKYKT